MTSFLFLNCFSEAAKLCSWACLYGRQRSVCHLCECCAETHLSSVAHADESAHWLKSTGSTGQEVGAVVGLQEANKVGALRLRDTERWTFVKASILKEIHQKIHFIGFPPHFYTIRVHRYLKVVYRFLHLQFPQLHKNKLAQLMGKGLTSVEEVWTETCL